MEIEVKSKFVRPSKNEITYQEAVNRLAGKILIHSYWEQNEDFNASKAGQEAWGDLLDYFGNKQQVGDDRGRNELQNESIELIEKEGSVEIWRLAYKKDIGGRHCAAVVVFA